MPVPTPHPLVNIAAQAMGISEAEVAFWEVSDYGLVVSLQENFYKTLPFQRGCVGEFFSKKASGTLTARYKDSRSVTRPALKHFMARDLVPTIADIGGYLGRFSIETALVAQELNCPVIVTAFEPSAMADLLQLNLRLNNVAVTLNRSAASAATGEATLKYYPGGLISGSLGGEGNIERNVGTVTLHDALGSQPIDALIVKIDTKGHDVDVMRGMGDLLDHPESVILIEYCQHMKGDRIRGERFEDFIANNFRVFYIRSVLYPDSCEELTLLSHADKYLSGKTPNIDLMLINRKASNINGLVHDICRSVNAKSV